MEKVSFKFSSGGRVAIITDAGIFQKGLMFEYLMGDDKNEIGYYKHPEGIRVCTNSYFVMARFCEYMIGNADPDDYDQTITEFLKISNPQTIK